MDYHEIKDFAASIRIAWKKRCQGAGHMGEQLYYIEELEYFDEVAAEMIEGKLHALYRAGQLAMRERAAVGLEEMGCSCHLASTPKGHCPHELALEIRALAPEEPT